MLDDRIRLPCRCRTQRSEERNRRPHSDPGAQLLAFGASSLPARGEPAVVAPRFQERNAAPLDLLMPFLQWFPLVTGPPEVVACLATQHPSAPPEHDTHERGDPRVPCRPRKNLRHIHGGRDHKPRGSHKEQKHARQDAQKSARASPERVRARRSVIQPACLEGCHASTLACFVPIRSVP